jgi:uncharacterized protein YqjF (DUF2071 family)
MDRSAPVIWQQHWRDVLFLHFRLAADQLSAHLPRRLEVDLFDGQAWLTYVFFRLKLRPAGMPFLAGLSSLVELNVRIYVRYQGAPGIYFLRMYADNWLAILTSRLLTPLCYEQATMIDRRHDCGSGHIECRPAAMPSSVLSADVEIAVPPTQPPPDSLDAWLVERYRLFVEASNGSMLAAEVEHPPWLISHARLSAANDSLSRAMGLSVSAEPALAHYSPGVTARFNAFHRVTMHRS